MINQLVEKNGSIIERCICLNGKRAITYFEVLKEFEECSLVKCILETGRTHQIRVHFASIGHPILGDELYGESSSLIKGQALVCSKLEFNHPISSKTMCFEIKENPFAFLVKKSNNSLIL